LAAEFDGLKAIVTGGASGIGAATASYLMERGCAVAVLDLAPASAPEGAIRITCDVADAASVETAVDEAVRTLGGLARKEPSKTMTTTSGGGCSR
jgi:NAD(P)-dependent dehydrogenase (short-subunit alcohol dehydrogenase family)